MIYVKEQDESPVEDMCRALEDHEMKRIKDDAVPYAMPSILPDSIRVQHSVMYDVPHVKGGRYHEPPRDLKKKKKAKRRTKKQARRKRR